jgi:tetrapyrrole methylase family protein/MazG family protein
MESDKLEKQKSQSAEPVKIPDSDTPFYNLVRLMEILRGPDGCPWDKEQDIQSLKRYFLEEAKEAFDAVEKEDWDGMMEEAGDVIFGMIFLAQIGKEKGKFTIDDSLRTCLAKMVRRHPHVFADMIADTPEKVTENWYKIKKTEKRSDKTE